MTRLCRSLLAFLAVLPLLASADDLALRPDHPDVYVVVRGDTLWDISGRFLSKPWHWPKLLARRTQESVAPRQPNIGPNATTLRQILKAGAV
jgi:hypothetical protein